jgi:membrane associated rhomboid family serine protease
VADEGKQPNEAPPDGGGWIEAVVSVAAALGFNAVRVRWKLHRMQTRWQRWNRRTEQTVAHVRYAHKVCPACGAVQDRDEPTCSRCGEQLGARRWQVLQRLGIATPQLASMSGLIGLAIVVVYARLLLIARADGILGMPIELVYRFGGNWPPAVEAGEHWRWGTAIFLHYGVIHLGFNLFALAAIGPQLETIYGRWQVLFLFMLTGVVANIASGATGLDGISAGASGSVMGLIGVAAGWGQRDGTTIGRSVRNDMIKWTLYVLFFGLFINADNRAHLGGFISGAIVGFAVRPAWLRARGAAPVRFVSGLVGLAAAVASVWLALAPPAPRVDPFAHEPMDYAGTFETLVTACQRYRAGDVAGAEAALSEGFQSLAVELRAAIAADACNHVEAIRAECGAARSESPGPPMTPEERTQLEAMCDAVDRAGP